MFVQAGACICPPPSKLARTTFNVRVEEGQMFHCECGLFGHFGIVCRHVIRLMIHLGLERIPECHIMKRWTKSARDILGTSVGGDLETDLSLPRSFRHNIMYASALELVKMGDVAESNYRIVMKHITAANEELRENYTPVAPLYYSSGGEDNGGSQRSNASAAQLEGLADSGAMTSDVVVVKEPLIRRGRGRPKATRFKSFMDGANKNTDKGKSLDVARPKGLSQQTNFCKHCRKPGHNSATCTAASDCAPSDVNKSAGKNPRKKNRCHKCNGLDHNSATCTDDLDGDAAGDAGV